MNWYHRYSLYKEFYVKKDWIIHFIPSIRFPKPEYSRTLSWLVDLVISCPITPWFLLYSVQILLLNYLFSPKVYSSKYLKVLSFIDTSITLPTYRQFCCPLSMIFIAPSANLWNYPWWVWCSLPFNHSVPVLHCLQKIRDIRDSDRMVRTTFSCWVFCLFGQLSVARRF